MRKHLLEYDDVANDQRQVVYQQRNDLLEDADISDVITNVRADVIDNCISRYIPPQTLEEQWDIAAMEQAFALEFSTKLPVQQWLDEDSRLDEETLRGRIIEALQESYSQRYAHVGAQMREVERQIMLQVLDSLWKDHLASMDQLRQGIGLRAYAQKNPKQEYKRESFALFEELLDNIKYETIRYLSHIEVSTQDEMDRLEQQRREEQKGREYQHAKAASIDDKVAEAPKPMQRQGPKVGRNDSCPCGSGKKYKQCHGKI
jgi:preprotein translocase subunit SecA